MSMTIPQKIGLAIASIGLGAVAALLAVAMGVTVDQVFPPTQFTGVFVFVLTIGAGIGLGIAVIAPISD